MKKNGGLTNYQLEIMKLAVEIKEIIRDDYSVEQTTIAHAPLRRDVIRKLSDMGLLDREIEALPVFSCLPPREIYRITEKGKRLIEKLIK